MNPSSRSPPAPGNSGPYVLTVGASACAILFAMTALFKQANKIEAGHLDEVDSLAVTL